MTESATAKNPNLEQFQEVRFSLPAGCTEMQQTLPRRHRQGVKVKTVCQAVVGWLWRKLSRVTV